MALVFPLGPAIGQQFTGTNGIVYEWTSIGAWDKVNSVQTARSGPTASTSSARIPVGNTAERPAPTLVAGQFRYNNQIPQLEYSDGTTWLPVSGSSIVPATLAEAQAGAITTKYSSPQTAVPKDASGMTGSAYLPAGTTAERPSPTAYTGQFRYNTTIPQLEYTNGTAWVGLGGLAAATLAQAQAGTLATVAATPQTAVPKDASGMTGSAFLPAGTTAQRPTASNYTGQFRYNTQIPQLEYSDGTTWIALGGLGAATLAQAQAGTLATVAATPQTAVPKDASGMTGSAYLPAGTTAQRPSPTAYTGQFRYNTTVPQLEYSDGSSWLPAAPPPGALTFAWVNFDGLVPSIRQSVNVSSVTSFGTGAYQINFTTPYYNNTNDYAVSVGVPDVITGYASGKVLTTGGTAFDPAATTPTYAQVGFGTNGGVANVNTFYAIFIG